MPTSNRNKAILPSLDAPVWSRWLLSLLLPLIAFVIYIEGQDYDPGLVQLQPAQAGSSHLPETLLALPRFGQIRRYHAENLYEYINGHAEYYLSAGFKLLHVTEYGPADAQQPEMVVNQYDMGEPLYAFGALMDELPPNSRPVDGVGSMAFASDSGLNLVLGPYYVQISLFSGKHDLVAAGKALDQALRQSMTDVAELELSFPDLGETIETLFVKEDYRGLSFLTNVIERVFKLGDEEITAFLINGSEDQITKTSKTLLKFLEQEGIKTHRRETDAIHYYLVDDPYEGEWFFVPGRNRLFGAFTSPKPEILKSIQGKAAEKSELKVE